MDRDDRRAARLLGLAMPVGLAFVTTLGIAVVSPPLLLKKANMRSALRMPKTAASMSTPRFRLDPLVAAAICRAMVRPPLGISAGRQPGYSLIRVRSEGLGVFPRAASLLEVLPVQTNARAIPPGRLARCSLLRPKTRPSAVPGGRIGSFGRFGLECKKGRAVNPPLASDARWARWCLLEPHRRV